MKNVLKIAAIAGAFGAMFSVSASANEVLLTASEAKSTAGAMALDLVTDGNVTAFEFTVSANGAKSVDTSKCLSELPKSHQGTCVFRAKTNDVIVIAFSPTNAVLPSGVVGLGSLNLPAASAAKVGVRADNVVFAGADGREIKANRNADSAMPRSEKETLK